MKEIILYAVVESTKLKPLLKEYKDKSLKYESVNIKQIRVAQDNMLVKLTAYQSDPTDTKRGYSDVWLDNLLKQSTDYINVFDNTGGCEYKIGNNKDFSFEIQFNYDTRWLFRDGEFTPNSFTTDRDLFVMSREDYMDFQDFFNLEYGFNPKLIIDYKNSDDDKIGFVIERTKYIKQEQRETILKYIKNQRAYAIYSTDLFKLNPENSFLTKTSNNYSDVKLLINVTVDKLTKSKTLTTKQEISDFIDRGGVL
jgi:hypothetical protein